MPTFSLSLDELGVAELAGRHAVVRALNDAAEREALAPVLRGLSESAQEDMFRERARHKAVAVVLHEIGHVLGSPHVIQTPSIMHPRSTT